MSGAAAARVSSIPAWRSRHRPYRPQTFQVTIRIVVSTTGPYGSYWLKFTAPVWRGDHSRKTRSAFDWKKAFLSAGPSGSWSCTETSSATNWYG